MISKKAIAPTQIVSAHICLLCFMPIGHDNTFDSILSSRNVISRLNCSSCSERLLSVASVFPFQKPLSVCGGFILACSHSYHGIYRMLVNDLFLYKWAEEICDILWIVHLLHLFYDIFTLGFVCLSLQISLMDR